MNATAWALLGVAALLLAWEAAVVVLGRFDLTISATVRSWGPWLALAIMLAATLFFWHVWIQVRT